ncbi:hypothetical protein [Klebsiella quasipneumoniae]|uniref:hypothetical protein n=1 Tax=Klebsiella quasipneumoniae TaxID=1463165 RepID=UPI00292BF750|nr:hypothetical protein [Klebsiella quasipneumoniae]MDV0546676.1 hypothetical protein [Klebsiella quasipneumoniae subsp. similipneumoniae]
MNISTVNELIASLESAGELSIREQKFLKLAKAYQQLAAENVGLNSFIVDACWIVDDGQYCDATDFMPETPATDAYLAGIKADGVEEFASYISLYNSNAERHAIDFAKQLREGASE